MKIINLKKLKPKDLIVFDVDGTLAPTKSAMDKEMAGLLKELLKVKKVAIISGAKLQIMQMQVLNELKVPGELLNNLYLFPTTATSFYKHNKSWKRVYALTLSKAKYEKIKKAFERTLLEINYMPPKKIYGPALEHRGSQVSYSFLGQDIVKILGKKGIKMKEEWKAKHTPLKMKVAKYVAKYLPDLEVHAAGFTTIDVTNKGIDKAYGLKQIENHLHVPIKKMLFLGDAIFKGGNDYAITKTPIDYVAVKNPEETKRVISHILSDK